MSVPGRHWAGVVRSLEKLKAHPEQEAVLGITLAVDISLAAQELTSLKTWKNLLQQQVPLKVLTACSDLLLICPIRALAAADVLLGRAVADLIQGPSSSGGSSSSTLTATLWGQLEQSGMLQQLPALLSSSITAMQAVITAGGDGPTDKAMATRDSASMALGLLKLLKQLRPRFFEHHAAGQQCILPVMQLSLLLLRHVSEALPHEGSNDSLDECVSAAWIGVHAAAAAADLLYASGTAVGAGSQALVRDVRTGMIAIPGLLGTPDTPGQAGGSSSLQQVVEALSNAEEPVQCCCLGMLVWMLVSFMQEAPGSSTGGGSNTGGSSSNTDRAVPSRSGRAGAGAAGRNTSSQQSAGGATGRDWRPAALAPSMPAVYATMLQRLGLSREVGLWLAEGIGPAPAAAEAADIPGLVHEGLALNARLQAATHNRQVRFPKQTVPVQALLPAVTLQWLASLPAAELLHMGRTCVSVCSVAWSACRDAEKLIEEHEWTLEDEGVTGDLTLSEAAYQDIVVLSAALLDKLLGMCRALPSTTFSSSGSNSSDHDMLLQTCESVVALLASGLKVCAEQGVMVRLAAAAAPGGEGSQGQGSSSSSNNSLPVTCAQLCKLLQEFLRLEVAAAAAAAATPGIGRPASTWVIKPLQMMHPIFVRDPSSCSSAWDTGGPLVAPVVGAADASSADTLQLFGLLCSLLKLYSNPSLLAQALELPVSVFVWPGLGSAVSAAVYWNLEAALRSTLSVTPGESSSNSSSSCAAALPWLVLLGRCCLASVVMLQHWQSMLGTVGAPGSSSGRAWPEHRRALVESLHNHLRPAIMRTMQWLASAGNVQQLSALGYQPQDLLQQLTRAADALTAASNDLPATLPYEAKPWDAHRAAAVLAAIQQPLQAAGSVLTCFATRQACNNPGCTNMAGPSEARLVGGHSCTCSGCRAARYCGRDPCQLAHWKQHKPVCKALAAAAAAAAEAAAKSGNRTAV